MCFIQHTHDNHINLFWISSLSHDLKWSQVDFSSEDMIRKRFPIADEEGEAVTGLPCFSNKDKIIQGASNVQGPSILSVALHVVVAETQFSHSHELPVAAFRAECAHQRGHSEVGAHRSADRWQAARLQSLPWVGVHPEVPNSSPGSHRLTSVRVSVRAALRVQPQFTAPSDWHSLQLQLIPISLVYNTI